MTELSTSYPPAVQRHLGTNAKEKELILSLLPEAGICENAKVRFEGEGVEITVSLCPWPGMLSAVLSVETDDFRKLIPIRRWLRQQGLPAPTIRDDAGTRTRTWDYGRVRLYGRLPVAGGVCQYVKVGTRIVDEFKLVCPETPAMPAMDELEEETA